MPTCSHGYDQLRCNFKVRGLLGINVTQVLYKMIYNFHLDHNEPIWTVSKPSGPFKSCLQAITLCTFQYMLHTLQNSKMLSNANTHIQQVMGGR